MSSKQCENCKLTMIGEAYLKMIASGHCPNCNLGWRCNCLYEPDMMDQVPLGSSCPFCLRPRWENLMGENPTPPSIYDIVEELPDVKRNTEPEFNSLSDEADVMREQRDTALKIIDNLLLSCDKYVQHIKDLNVKLFDTLDERDEARELAGKYYKLDLERDFD